MRLVNPESGFGLLERRPALQVALAGKGRLASAPTIQCEPVPTKESQADFFDLLLLFGREGLLSLWPVSLSPAPQDVAGPLQLGFVTRDGDDPDPASFSAQRPPERRVARSPGHQVPVGVVTGVHAQKDRDGDSPVLA